MTDPSNPTPYGGWPSPLSARDAFAAGTDRSVPLVDGGTVWWLEARPEDEGRQRLVRRDVDGGGETADVSPPEADVRTRYQEYGGGTVGVSDGLVLYVDFADQRVRRADVGGGRGARDGEGDHDVDRDTGGGAAEPRPITPESDGLVRYSCFRIDRDRGVAFCLREDQRDSGVEPVTSLVRLDLDGPNDDYGVEVVAGRRRPWEVDGELPDDLDSAPDFVSDPVLSPDGTLLSWVSWNHPHMAWDGTWLWAGRLDDAGDLHDVARVAGAEDEAVEQPRWLDDHRLVFLSDRTGWSNLYSADLSDDRWGVTPLGPEDRDYGRPRWVPDMSTYDLLPRGRVVTTRLVEGRAQLCVLDLATGDLTTVPSDVSGVSDVRALGEDHAVCRAAFVDRPADVVVVDLRDGTTVSIATAGEAPEPVWVSHPEAVSWTSEDGATAHGFLYPPTNPDVTPPVGEQPPLIVTLHGGPTSAAPAAYTRARTFWTSRGFAVLDVNYAGSTGYGRAYRKRLEGAWGVAEVADVASGARHLAALGRVDGARTAIMGGSAGGFTTLAALTFTDAFSAGASYFGVSDLAALARETHKLESRYLWGLVAPWPEGEDVYTARSPIHHVDRLETPLILLQGTDDRVVPPNQAEMMAEAVRAKGLPVALVMFEGEGHGFRDPANQARALECELSFYGQVFGFTPAGDVERVEVENLPPAG